MKPNDPNDPGNCWRATDVIGLIGDKWSIQIVMCLGRGQRRFSEIRREIERISQKMLTGTLRGLERDGYVRRTIYATVPPRVDYELTDLGWELHGPLRNLGDWAIVNYDRVKEARADYDARAAAKAAE